MNIPDHRLAICRRCRWPERIAAAADSAESLLEHARGATAAGRCAVALHARLSQCLNCCDGGHTVRVEHCGREVALVGVRTRAELDELLGVLDEVARGSVPERLERKVYQVWIDGRMVFHRTWVVEGRRDPGGGAG
jgi:hypothetical protein